jgi:ABC-2 type transport system permease protein
VRGRRTSERGGGAGWPVVRAFLLRDVQVAWSYSFPFVLEVAAAGFTILTYSFVARLVPAGAVPKGYFSFVVAGLVGAAFLQAAVSVLAGNVRQEQVQGTLEVILSHGLPVPVLAAATATYPLLAAAVRAAVYVALAAAFGARAPGANWGLGVAAMAVGSVSFAGIGLVGAALVLVLRRALAATGWLISMLALAAGVLFPTRLLPGWVRSVAEVSPFTLTLRLARGAVLEGGSWGDAWPSLGILGVEAVGWGLVGIGALWLSLARLRHTGDAGLY